MDVVIPVVFPDYLIAVETPGVKFKVPDLLPFVDVLPDVLRVEASKKKLPELGHAGALFFNGKTGLTKYYEYGRYPPAAALGLTQRRAMPDVRIASNGRPTKASLITTLAKLSKLSGQGGRISGAYIEVPDGKFADMLQYAQKREAQNRVATRPPYTLTGNSCMHFSKAVAESAGVKIPWIVDPRPNSYIGEVQSKYPALEFAPPATLTVKGVPGF